jgi:hypothetical protein
VKPHAFHPEAAEEYVDAANYYTQIYPQKYPEGILALMHMKRRPGYWKSRV